MRKIFRKYLSLGMILCALLFVSSVGVQAATTGWVIKGNKYYYKVNDKYVKHNIIKIGQSYYAFDDNGLRKTGWVSFKGYKYYFDSKTGKGYIGVHKIGNYFYLFNTQGKLVTNAGLYKTKTYSYYVQSGGKLKTGFVKINNKYYYFKPQNARMAKSETITSSGYKYYVFSSGVVRCNCWFDGKYYDSHGQVTSTKTSEIHLYRADGTLWKTVDNTNGTATFPVVDLNSADMCLGWAKAKGKSTLSSSDYKFGSTIPTRTGNYYMIVFKKSMDTAPASITTASNYKMVYMVGDSRTVDTSYALGSKTPSNVKFIASSGKGLSWFDSTGYGELMEAIKRRSAKEKKAVVVNLGVNDLYNASAYVARMKDLAKELKQYNCTMFYMSVNPVNSAMIKRYGAVAVKTESEVYAFNSTIYNNLCQGSGKCFTYINTYSNLITNGWSSNRLNNGVYDGLHYSCNTYLRIFNSCMNFLKKH